MNNSPRCAPDGLPKILTETLEAFKSEKSRHTIGTVMPKTIFDQLEKIKQNNLELYNFHKSVADHLEIALDTKISLAYLKGVCDNYSILARQLEVNYFDDKECKDGPEIS